MASADGSSSLPAVSAADVRVLAEAVSAGVVSYPVVAESVAYDLHAILNGWETIGSYSPRDRALLRVSLGFVSPAELTTLVGPPQLPDSSG